MSQRKKSSDIRLPWEKPHTDLPIPPSDMKNWLAETDKLCRRRFDTSQPLPPDSHRDMIDSQFAPTMNQNVLQEMAGARRLTCCAHQQLSRDATALFTENDFEQNWLALEQEQQEKHLLNAFKVQQSAPGEVLVRDVPEKLNCPELCRDALLKDGGRGFLDLIKIFFLENNDEPPTQPLNIPNARFDAIIGWKGDDDNGLNMKAWLGLRRMIRTRHILTFCNLVIADYIGEKTEFFSYTHEHKTKEALRGMAPIVDEFTGPSSTKQWVKEQKAQRKEMKLFCDSCLKPEDKKEGKMSVCVKCRAVGREVRYCGKECQRAAWKGHKRECGKNLDINAAFEDVTPVRLFHRDTVASRIDIPPAAPGHRRTPDLLRLISFLNKFPKWDYILVLPSPNPHEPELERISLDHLPSAAVFTIIRNRALRDASESALLYLYCLLQRHPGLIVNEKILQAQMRKEYGSPFERMLKALESGNPPATPEVSTQETDVALGFLKQLGRFQEELAEYVPGNVDGKKTITIAVQVGLNKELTIMVGWPEEITLPSAVGVYMIPPKSSAPDPPGGSNNIEKSSTGPNHFVYLMGSRRSAALDKQLRALEENPTADYILWDESPSDSISHTVRFDDFTECVAFLCYRRRLFIRGTSDPDALAYLIMALEPAMMRQLGAKTMSKSTLYEQLGREYGRDFVGWVVGRIKGDKYHAPDGKEFLIGEIPAARMDFDLILQQLKATRGSQNY